MAKKTATKGQRNTKKQTPKTKIERYMNHYGISRREATRLARSGAYLPRRGSKVNRKGLSGKMTPLPAEHQSVSFDGDKYACYGKQTKRGYRAYCRKSK